MDLFLYVVIPTEGYGLVELVEDAPFFMREGFVVKPWTLPSRYISSIPLMSAPSAKTLMLMLPPLILSRVKFRLLFIIYSFMF